MLEGYFSNEIKVENFFYAEEKIFLFFNFIYILFFLIDVNKVRKS